jgi:hypothetical protein
LRFAVFGQFFPENAAQRLDFHILRFALHPDDD